MKRFSRYFAVRAAALVWCGIAQHALAQNTGNDNPTGVAGVFNGNSMTGCSYDPYTGNATRTVVDITVSGAVGAYPLQWSRTMNSRAIYTGGGDFQHADAYFGWGGGWSHSYGWDIVGGSNTTTITPSYYTVFYPDGRQITFTSSSSDPGFYHGPRGVPDRFQAVGGAGYCYLVLPDGGKIQFYQTYSQDGPDGARYYSFDLTPTAIIDPQGLKTTFSYDAYSELSQITEPGGRWLRLSYRSDGFLSGVTAGYTVNGVDTVTQYVNYTYGTYNGYTVLSGVNYSDAPDYGSTGDAATYSYQNSNNAGASSYPLILTCNDTHYAGPMKSITYSFVSGGYYGQIAAEQHFPSPGSSPAPGPTPLTVVSYNISNHTETRGDGYTRTWSYGQSNQPYSVPCAYLLGSYTDFTGATTNLGYDNNGFINTTRDANQHVTSMTRIGNTGTLASVTHPPDSSGVSSTIYYTYTDQSTGYYKYSVKDERGYITTYKRDASNRVYEIDYPDGGYETFGQFNSFNQATSHRMTSGGTETFGYDGRGLLRNYTPPATTSDGNPSAHPTRYDYDVNDHLQYITDPHSYQTQLYHNQRGQLTIVQHPDTDRSLVGYAYNNDGTLQYSNVQYAAGNNYSPTYYYYDDYKRVTSIIDPTTQTTSFNYTPWNTSSSYLHTGSEVFIQTFPTQRVIHFGYDGNFRRTFMRQAPDTSDNAWTYYGYDAVGNLSWTQDPRQYIYCYDYDSRNRLTVYTPPDPTTGFTTRGNPSRATFYSYDQAGNRIGETRPNTVLPNTRSWQYDVMNRLQDTYGFGGEHTHYVHDYAGNVTSLVDPNNNPYGFGFDYLNRKTSATYPPDAYGVNRSESWHYDIAGNVDQYTKSSGQVQHFTPDARNRVVHTWWDGGVGPDISTGYDDASRVTSIITNSGETTLSFGYDAANHKVDEWQTVSGYNTHHLHYEYNADGLRQHMGTDLHNAGFRYSQRNELTGLGDDSSRQPGNPDNGFFEWMHFYRDPNGNLTQRHTWTGSDQTFSYDEWNGMTMSASQFPAGEFAGTHYHYDNVGRETAEWRDEQGNKGEYYTYDATDQLHDAYYNADTVYNNAPANWTSHVTYTNDALNRQSVNANGTVAPYTPDGMNQYVQSGWGLGYDGNFNTTAYTAWGGWTYSYNAQNQLTSAGGGGNSVQNTYDGLGRCLKRTINGGITIYVYDGWSEVNEFDGSNHSLCWKLFGPGGPDDIQMRVPDGTAGPTTIFHKDRRGSVTFLTDTGTAKLEKYTYDAFGTPTVVSWNTATNSWDDAHPRGSSNYSNRLMWQGREYFVEMGVMDFRNRWYHPALGRFLQVDPLGFGGGDNNLYRFCNGDPINGSDPDGLWQLVIFGGRGYGGFLTLGYNSGQWSYGAFVGAAGGPADGAGAAYAFTLNNLPAHESGAFTGYVSAAGYGRPGAGIGVTSFGGSIGDSTIVTSRVGPQQLSLRGATSFARSGVTFTKGIAGGAAMFAGVGVVRYTEPPPPPPGGTTDVNSVDCGPNCVTAERVVVTATNTRSPQIIDGVFWKYGYGNISSTANWAGGTARTNGGGNFSGGYGGGDYFGQGIGDHGIDSNGNWGSSTPFDSMSGNGGGPYSVVSEPREPKVP